MCAWKIFRFYVKLIAVARDNKEELRLMTQNSMEMEREKVSKISLHSIHFWTHNGMVAVCQQTNPQKHHHSKMSKEKKIYFILRAIECPQNNQTTERREQFHGCKIANT